jgi:hypothetical protein
MENSDVVRNFSANSMFTYLIKLSLQQAVYQMHGKMISQIIILERLICIPPAKTTFFS